ncbi:GPI-anchored surface protein, putative [Bodo saltans]|uniref:GPI-anchored surface protein, putative n=1 Tax=Bodo saltans TaxID=75058 RepID=A0A0S4KLL3_BODSA|nr:GPI-anchored surface protein, putative [Bodo saltans]|eukprot:CUI15385.1 GPI-anchored surface protein, putative [Bodo saltans]
MQSCILPRFFLPKENSIEDMSTQIITLTLLVAASFIWTASAAVAANVNDDPTTTYQYCGAMPPGEVGTAQSMIVNATLHSDGTYIIAASLPTNFPTTCIQEGTYTYDAVNKKDIFAVSTAPHTPGVIYCTTWFFNFTYALETSRTLSFKKVTLYGYYMGNEMVIPADSNYCFARVPSGKYCGSALDVPANLVISAPYNFALNIEAPIDPCTVMGYYVLNVAYGNVVYEVGAANCTQYLIFNNITYGNNPSQVTMVGSAYGIGFTATLTQAQCP